MTSNQPPFRLLGVCCAFAAAMGLGAFFLFDALPPVYRAEAKILLLSPQERYLPTIQTASTDVGEDEAPDRVAQALGLIGDAVLLGKITDQFGLVDDPDLAKPSLWRPVSTLFSGLQFPGLQDDKGSKQGPVHQTRAIVIENLRNNIALSYQPARGVLTVRYHAPGATQATVLANVLAQSYLEQQRALQIEQYTTAIRHLEADAAALQTQWEKTNAMASPLSAPQDLSETDRAHWETQEDRRRDMVAQRARAEKRMLEHVLQRLQEARTRLSLDLLPPTARLLARATMPERPLDRRPLLMSATAAGGGMLLSLLLGYYVRARRKAAAGQRLQSGHTSRMAPAVSLPRASIPLVPDESVDAHRSHLGVEERQLVKANRPDRPELDGEQKQGEELQDPLLISRMALNPSQSKPPSQQQFGGAMPYADYCQDLCRQILSQQHRRIVLLSDEDHIAYQAEALACSLTTTGRSVAYVSFRDDWMALHRGARKSGISDLLDGYVGSLDIVKLDAVSTLARVELGYRPLTSEDFYGEAIHVFLLALEATYDHLIIDIGDHFANEIAIKSLAVSPGALALIHDASHDAPSQYRPSVADQSVPDLSMMHGDIVEVMRLLGYGDCLIVPSVAFDHAADQLAILAAE